MSTPQNIPHLNPRLRIGLKTALTALGALLAIAVTITILALTGANHITVATPVTASQAASSATPQIRYLGPQQVRAALNPQSGSGTTNTAGASTPPHYDCLGAAQRCLR